MAKLLNLGNKSLPQGDCSSRGTQVDRFPGDLDYKKKWKGIHVFDFTQNVTPDQISHSLEVFDLELRNQRKFRPSQ